MPIISGFGSGTTSLDQEVRKEDNLRTARRASQRKTYEEWKSQKLKDGITLTPQDMNTERLMITNGDNLAASHIGQRATDAAVAFRHNEGVAQKIRTDVLKKSETLNKVKTSLMGSVNAADKTYGTFVKRTLDKMFPHDPKVKAYTGKDNEDIPQIGQDYLKQANFGQTEWHSHRGDLQNVEINKIAVGDRFLNINEKGDIKTEYSHLAPWLIKGLERAFDNKEDRITKETMVKVLTAMAGAEITDLEFMSDDDLKLYAENAITAAFAMGKAPTGAKWDAMVQRAVQGLKNKRTAMMGARRSKGVTTFAGKWAANPKIQNMLASKVADSGVVWSDKDFQSEVNTLASASGLGENYFDFANDSEEANRRLKAILGQRPYDLAKKSMIHRKDAAAAHLRSLQATADAAKEKEAHESAVKMAFSRNREVDGDDAKKGIWSDGGSATAAFTYINSKKFVPFADLTPVLQKIKKGLSAKGATAESVAQKILAENGHWKNWAGQAAVHQTRYKPVVSVKANTDPVDQYFKLFKNIKTIENAVIDRIEAAPKHNFDFRPGVEQWVGRDFNIAKVRTDWDLVIDLRLERLTATFGDKMYAPMFDFPEGGFDPDTSGSDLHGFSYTQGRIMTMPDLYNFAKAKLERVRRRGHDRINDARPKGARKDTGQPIAILGLTIKQEKTLKPLAQAASMALTKGLPQRGQHRSVDQGLMLENFIPPGGTAKDHYKIPTSWYSDDGELGMDIIKNETVMAMAKSVGEMFPEDTDQDEAAQILRNMLLFGPRNAKGELSHKTTDNPFFRNTKVKKGSAGAYGGYGEHAIQEARIPGRTRFVASDSIYEKPLNTLIAGERDFFRALLTYGRLPKDDKQP
tara:strand:+ start:3933 stop:6515 length:2583 start_codon:yes stop_codon:yes gene_type:complete